MSEIDEDHPIYQAIDKGGGQTCDIRGVIRELNAAGYVIVPREPTEGMVKARCDRGHEIGADIDEAWRIMIDEALK